jgi:hypothetical protein
MKFLIRLLAAICIVCPVCALSRTRVGAFIARSGIYRAYSRFCPFCWAYRKRMKTKHGGTEITEDTLRNGDVSIEN